MHDAACYNSNDLANRTISDKIFKDRVYEIAINRNYGGVWTWMESELLIIRIF